MTSDHGRRHLINMCLIMYGAINLGDIAKLQIQCE